ncbi:MAG: hypothetical protein XU09_C0006G0045 [Thaumarchaeota archaeon CSP1-1]|nr:MAG: hypothetical protein XU09_C0006G0045 [Thaumarchaeota archaeon CSP1-1]
MASRIQVLVPITIAAVIVGLAGIMSLPSDVKLESVEFPRGTVKIDGVVLEVQIADTDPRRARGLMFQEQLPLDEGMLLVFDDANKRSIWMLNMQFPLDVIWIDDNSKVVFIEKNVPPCKTALETVTCPSYKGGSKDAKYVLEVTAGFVDAFKITTESTLEIISI